MPSPSKTLSKRAHERVETIEKRLKLPFVPVSTRVFYDILSKNDAHSEDVQDISLPKPKAILDYESVEYAIPGLKVPINEEDGEMDKFVEDYQEEEEESLEEGSILGRAKNKVLYNNISNYINLEAVSHSEMSVMQSGVPMSPEPFVQ